MSLSAVIDHERFSSISLTWAVDQGYVVMDAVKYWAMSLYRTSEEFLGTK